MNLYEFVERFKGDVFKILCLYDEGSSTIESYIENIRVQAVGAGTVFNWNGYGKQYTNMITGLQFLATNDFSSKECRRIILGIVNDLDRIQKDGDGRHGG